MKSIFTRFLLVLLCSGMFLSSQASLSVPVSNEPDPVTVKAALKEFRSLPARERRMRMREVRKALHQYKADRRAGRSPQAEKAVQVICAILLPPLGVYLHEGVVNKRFWIDLVLTLLFFIPGMIYALIVVLSD
jgi:uncharacterized membrane protein YqaE (UPF0057 family)